MGLGSHITNGASPAAPVQSGQRDSAPAAIATFYVISATYLAFTVTDTALRVAILLQANRIGFSSFDIALMFALYELCGVFTNFCGGVLGSKFGLKKLLLCGLCCQLVSVSALCPFPDAGSFDVFPTRAGRVVFIMFTQVQLPWVNAELQTPGVLLSGVRWRCQGSDQTVRQERLQAGCGKQ
jgi:MFS family permease